MKLQRVARPTNRSYYLTIPSALVDCMELEKGETLEWILEDKNTLVLRRSIPVPPKQLQGIASDASTPA
ncbi:MAG: hypothetical protein AAB288_06875 [Acidobacteriota bacterium]